MSNTIQHYLTSVVLLALCVQASAQPPTGPGAGAGRGRRLGTKRAPPAKPAEVTIPNHEQAFNHVLFLGARFLCVEGTDLHNPFLPICEQAGATAPAATAAQTTPTPVATGGGGPASTEAALREALARVSATTKVFYNWNPLLRVHASTLLTYVLVSEQQQAAARQGVPPQAGRGQQKRPASATIPQTAGGLDKPTGAPTAGEP